MSTSLDKWVGAAWRYAVSFALVLGGLAGGAGCRSTPAFGEAGAQKNIETVKLKPGLMISMTVLVSGKKEIDEPSKRISEGGTIALPLLGELDSAV